MSSSAASKTLTAAVDVAKWSAASMTRRRPMNCLASAPRLVSHPPDLIRWVRRQGGFVHPKLRIANHGSNGLGVSSDGEISAGTDLISLPGHIPLRLPGYDERCTVLFQLSQQVPEELWAMRLGLKLLQERATTGSFWWPYISNLPETFSVPIFFSGEDIKNLQYAPLVYQVNKRCRFLLDFEKTVGALLENVEQKSHPFSGQDVNASSLGWAMSAVSSRAFRLHSESLSDGQRTNIPMLLPLIDSCNHSFQPHAKIVQQQITGSSDMLVVAEKEIEQDNPITLNYGFLSNDLFLLDYGFVIPSNPYDYVELKYDATLLDAAGMAAGLSSPSFSSPAQWQEEILCQLNLLGDGATLKVSLGGSELVDGRLLAALRVLLVKDKELVQSHNLQSLMALSDEAPLGILVETTALRIIIALCVVALEHFPTKVTQDESVLKGSIPPSMSLAIQFRMQKKLMIIDVMRKLSQRIKMISMRKSHA
ncbi:[Fructose-bisphosphate aldolase]-lysine N-methyltransferase, chloroplastic [Apostasia shenzhenica]|uniref:[Fructose-bisphosphate aldolase]-lysine N-methyltransferase, chloroplastic n=1 Tax=Apostasia shenzhenica TaxID=1088818 RepID=A0A2I0B0X3_9ASPA|nr:[Fructose-bisphosphate aldolase]-lysine N-methyltransferase, chloroplastic [Apostasia shenzhenica]